MFLAFEASKFYLSVAEIIPVVCALVIAAADGSQGWYCCAPQEPSGDMTQWKGICLKMLVGWLFNVPVTC